MRRTILCLCVLALPACMQVTTQGPNGVETIMPLRQSILVRVYNKCVPILRADGRHHRIEIPMGGSGELQLWAVPGENNQQQEVVFDGFTSDRKGLGVAKMTFTPDYNSAITRKTWIIGADQGLSNPQGQDICRQYGFLDRIKNWLGELAE